LINLWNMCCSLIPSIPIPSKILSIPSICICILHTYTRNGDGDLW
jgi:hypothetical protein